jgi:transcriptional regulator with XRE-family HTH domain
VRKRKNLSQAEVGKKIGINGDAYGKYERNEVRPTIEMALKIAQALDVSLDYLTGNSNLELDKKALNRIQELSKLHIPEHTRSPEQSSGFPEHIRSLFA